MIRISKPGILPRQHLKQAVDCGLISASQPFAEHSFQPASLELRLGAVAYRLRAVFPPHSQRTIQESIDSLAEHTLRLDSADGAILENNHIYLIPLVESLTLPSDLRGKASPKSSIGRLDVFVRLLAEGATKFDDVPAGYNGALFVVVMPRSFAVVARTGDPLLQLRLMSAMPGAIVRDDELADYWSVHPLLYRPKNTAYNKPIGFDSASVEEGLFLSADFLRPPQAPLAYTPRREGAVVDLRERAHYDSTKFWAPALCSDEPNVLRLIPDAFYLLRCQEFLSIPPSLAAEMLPYDAQLGELRSHYAGFFDPGFGYDPSVPLHGTPAILEIRSREPLVLRHGHTLCRLQFFRMSEEPDLTYGAPALLSSYQQQRLPFSKQFLSAPTPIDFDTPIQHELQFSD